MLHYIAVGMRILLRAGEQQEAACGLRALEGRVPACDGHRILCSELLVWLGHLKLITFCEYVPDEDHSPIKTSLQSILMKGPQLTNCFISPFHSAVKGSFFLRI